MAGRIHDRITIFSQDACFASSNLVKLVFQTRVCIQNELISFAYDKFSAIDYVPFRYRRTRLAACICIVFGLSTNSPRILASTLIYWCALTAKYNDLQILLLYRFCWTGSLMVVPSLPWTSMQIVLCMGLEYPYWSHLITSLWRLPNAVVPCPVLNNWAEFQAASLELPDHWSRTWFSI